MAGTGPAIFQCSNTDRAPDDLVTVGADRGARAVVLKRAGPAGRRTSGRRNAFDNTATTTGRRIAPQPKATRQVRSLLPDRPHGIVMN